MAASLWAQQGPHKVCWAGAGVGRDVQGNTGFKDPSFSASWLLTTCGALGTSLLFSEPEPSHLH